MRRRWSALAVISAVSAGLIASAQASPMAKLFAKEDAIMAKSDTLKHIEERCGVKMKWKIDWASFPIDSWKDNVWEPSYVRSSCEEVANAIQQVCHRGGANVIQVSTKIDTFVCHYVPVGKLKKKKKSDYAWPRYRLVKKTLRIGMNHRAASYIYLLNQWAKKQFDTKVKIETLEN